MCLIRSQWALLHLLRSPMRQVPHCSYLWIEPDGSGCIVICYHTNCNIGLLGGFTGCCSINRSLIQQRCYLIYCAIVYNNLMISTELAVKQEMQKSGMATDVQLWPPVDISLIKSRRGDTNSKTEETRLRGVYFLVKQFTEEGKLLKDILKYVNESGIKTGSNKYWNIRSLNRFFEASERKFEPVHISAEIEPQLSEITEQSGISELEVYQYAKTRKQEGEVLKEIAAELNRLGSRTRSGKPWAISSVHTLLEEMPPIDLFLQQNHAVGAVSH